MNVFCVPCSLKKTNFVMSIKKIYNLISYNWRAPSMTKKRYGDNA